jgi:predicted metal-binding membrane protein
MSTMGGMAMPGGWTMSMAWMRMPGQTWLGAGATFIGMWSLMMVAMMLPVLVPELKRFRADGNVGARATLAFASGYFAVWAATGVALFPLGVAFAEAAMRSELVSRVTPLLGATVVLAAGVLQFSAWKQRRLACCRHQGSRGAPVRRGMRGAVRAGALFGRRCVYCCASLTAVLLVMGVMDLLAMALVTAAISAERLKPAGASTSRFLGILLMAGGGSLVLRAMF